MGTIFIKSKNSKTSDPHRIATDKIDSKRGILFIEKCKQKVIWKQWIQDISPKMEWQVQITKKEHEWNADR